MLMPLIIIGGILSGVFTPTEAAAVAAMYGLFVGLFIYREIKPRDLLPIAVRVVKSTAVVLFIVSAATVLQYIFARESVSGALQTLAQPFMANKTVALIPLTSSSWLPGLHHGDYALLLIFTPLFLPLVDAMGIDRVHFGVFFVLNLMIGTITPPVGTVMYIVLNISKIKMSEFAREIWPMFLALTAVLFIITFFPDLVLFLPNLLLGASK